MPYHLAGIGVDIRRTGSEGEGTRRELALSFQMIYKSVRGHPMQLQQFNLAVGGIEGVNVPYE